jgi:hypothetical protein
MKAKRNLTATQSMTTFTLITFLIFCFVAVGQNAQDNKEAKVNIGAGAGSILHLNDDNDNYSTGLNSSIEVNYSIFPYLGVSFQAGINKLNVSSRDEDYLLLEDSKFTPLYSTVDFSEIDSEPGMDMIYVIGGPLYTYSSGNVNFDLIPKAGVAFTSPFYQYSYTIEGYSDLDNFDRDIVSYEGNNSISFLLDIEFAIRTQLTDSGWGFKFFTKFIHSSFIQEMTRTSIYESRDNPEGPIEFESKLEESDDQKVEVNALIFGLSLTYSF